MNIQDFTTPILKTSGTRTLEYRVVGTTPEDINTYLSHHIKGSYIALPANSDVLSDLRAQDFKYLIVRAAYHQPSDHKLVYTAIVIVPSYTCVWNKGFVTTPVAQESLKKVGQALATKHHISNLLYVSPNGEANLLDTQGIQQDTLSDAPTGLPIDHLCKQYGCDSFVEYYLNARPQGVSSAYMRDGELFIQIKK